MGWLGQEPAFCFADALLLLFIYLVLISPSRDYSLEVTMLYFRAYALFQMAETFASLTIFLASLENISIESQLWVYSPRWQLLAESESSSLPSQRNMTSGLP